MYIRRKNSDGNTGVAAWICISVLSVAVTVYKTSVPVTSGFIGYADAVLVSVIAVSFLAGERAGGVCGLICGVLLAATGNCGIMPDPLFYTLAGYFASVAAREIFGWNGSVDSILPTVLTFTGLLACRMVMTLFGAMLNSPGFNLWSVIIKVVFPEALATLIAFAALWGVILLVCIILSAASRRRGNLK